MVNAGVMYQEGEALVPLISAVVVCVISYYTFRWISGDEAVLIRDVSKNHNWKDAKIAAKAWYCSICKSLLVNGIGVYCDCCGVCSDADCISKANKSLPCKVITSKNGVQLHHWVKGNLPLGAVCEVCQEECSLEPGLVDYQCCWCQRSVHTDCFNKLGDECDFGVYRNLIVPPWCVQVAKRKSSIHKRMLLRGVKNPGWDEWCPLIVVANRKSGNADGDLILSEFRRVLNPAQVLDLAERPPTAALQWSILVSPRPIKILVAGGDGTIAWILTTIHKLDLEPAPPVAILPLGTGNDLSRVLGWGKANSTELDIRTILDRIRDAHRFEIDRWCVDILPYRQLGNLGIRMPAKTLYMYNYMSIGVDAQVAFDFHKARNSRFYLFGSRILNKLLYLCFGTQQVVTADCRNVEKRLELFLDGRLVSLPELESVVILNISSWGAGVDLWGMFDEGQGQSFSDGVLEVVGIYSSFHIAQLQVGLSKPHKIGQARKVEVHLKATAPIQIDGEPWEQHPAQLKVSLVDQAAVLVNRKGFET